MPGPTTSLEFRVRYAETDQMGVVYHAHYLVWCELGRTDYIRSRGITYAAMEQSGVLLAVSEATVRYRAPARYDELVRVETTLAHVRSRALVFDYAIRNAATGERYATAQTALVSIDRASRPIVLPAEIRRLLPADVA